MVFEINYLINFKVFFVAILIYVIIFTLLKKLQIFSSDEKTSSLIALITAIIVSFTGILTYTVTYAITWFAVILFVAFLIFILMSFMGVKIEDIHALFNKNSKIVLIVFLLLFSIIFIKSFFALNNSFDLSNPNNDSYAVNSSFNTGVDDIDNGKSSSFFQSLNIDSDIVSAAAFLLLIGGFVMLIG